MLFGQNPPGGLRVARLGNFSALSVSLLSTENEMKQLEAAWPTMSPWPFAPETVLSKEYGFSRKSNSPLTYQNPRQKSPVKTRPVIQPRFVMPVSSVSSASPEFSCGAFRVLNVPLERMYP